MADTRSDIVRRARRKIKDEEDEEEADRLFLLQQKRKGESIPEHHEKKKSKHPPSKPKDLLGSILVLDTDDGFKWVNAAIFKTRSNLDYFLKSIRREGWFDCVYTLVYTYQVPPFYEYDLPNTKRKESTEEFPIPGLPEIVISNCYMSLLHRGMFNIEVVVPKGFPKEAKYTPETEEEVVFIQDTEYTPYSVFQEEAPYTAETGEESLRNVVFREESYRKYRQLVNRISLLCRTHNLRHPRGFRRTKSKDQIKTSVLYNVTVDKKRFFNLANMWAPLTDEQSGIPVFTTVDIRKAIGNQFSKAVERQTMKKQSKKL
jgi:hypothetical protein